MKILPLLIFLSVLSFAGQVVSAPKAHASIKVDGKDVDLSKLTAAEIVTLSDLILKASGTPKPQK